MYVRLPIDPFNMMRLICSCITNNPIGLYVYGYESFDSYGYPGGFSAE